jgi:hypothetical protein
MKTRRQRKKKNKISSDTYSDTDDEIASALVRSTAAGAAVTTATLVRRTRGCGDDGGLVVLMTVIVPVVDNDVSLLMGLFGAVGQPGLGGHDLDKVWVYASFRVRELATYEPELLFRGYKSMSVPRPRCCRGCAQYSSKTGPVPFAR